MTNAQTSSNNIKHLVCSLTCSLIYSQVSSDGMFFINWRVLTDIHSDVCDTSIHATFFFWHLVWVGLSSALTSSPSDLANFMCHIIWLVVSTYPSEKWWSSSVGMMTFPYMKWKIKHVPNHQPVIMIHPDLFADVNILKDLINQHQGTMYSDISSAHPRDHRTCGEHVGNMWGKCEPPKPCTKPFTRQTRRHIGTLPKPLGMVQSRTPLYFFLVYFNWFSSGTLW